MSLNATPRGDRIHIALFGKRNAGKSSVINAMTNQELAIVSNVKGTTTDPVYKAMELLPLGPVVMIDTPGLDDEGELGEKRVKKAKEVLAKADIALVIMDATAGMTEFEEDMIRLIEDRKIPYLKVYNKMDLANAQEWKEDKACFVSAKDKKGIWELKEEIGKLVPTDDDTLKIVGDLVCPNDFVILVVPIDSAAPKGRWRPSPCRYRQCAAAPDSHRPPPHLDWQPMKLLLHLQELHPQAPLPRPSSPSAARQRPARGSRCRGAARACRP